MDVDFYDFAVAAVPPFVPPQRPVWFICVNPAIGKSPVAPTTRSC